MVHALEIAHRLLRDGGVLIDLMPMDFDWDVLVRAGQRWRHYGMVIVDDPDVRGATQAVRRVVKRGLYREEQARVILVRRFFDSARDWKSELSDLTTSFAEPGLADRIDRYFKSNGRSARVQIRDHLTVRALVKA